MLHGRSWPGRDAQHIANSGIAANWAPRTPALPVSDDSIYLTGVYQNNSNNGSVPPEPLEAVYVARYSVTGERIWFRQIAGAGHEIALHGYSHDRLYSLRAANTYFTQ